MCNVYPNAVCQDVERTAKIQSRMLPVWKKFLTNQFHDVIPGSCIKQVCLFSLRYVNTPNFLVYHVYGGTGASVPLNESSLS